MRQQALANHKTREMLLFQHHHAQALFIQQSRRHRPGRAAADNGHITICVHLIYRFLILKLEAVYSRSSQAANSRFNTTPSATVVPKAATAGVLLNASRPNEMPVVSAASNMPPSRAGALSCAA